MPSMNKISHMIIIIHIFKKFDSRVIIFAFAPTLSLTTDYVGSIMGVKI